MAVFASSTGKIAQLLSPSKSNHVLRYAWIVAERVSADDAQATHRYNGI